MKRDFESKGKQRPVSVVKKVDVLAKAAAAETLRTCKHPHLKFKKAGYELNCVDCKRRWITALPEYEIADFLYTNPSITDEEFRHSPYEPQRREPKIR